MPPRDEQDYEQRRQQIIDGALHVFANKGFEKATNKDIAEAAGIGSPGLIYHYFKDKADLLGQVLEQRSPALQLFARPETSEMFMALPPREALTLLGQNFLKILEDRAAVAAFKVMVGEAARQPAVAEMFGRIGPGRALPIIARYLERQMDAGLLRRMNPAAAARCFIGDMLAYILTLELFPLPDTNTIGSEAMVATAVDIFLHGMQIDDGS